jgi:hypothetical protein
MVLSLSSKASSSGWNTIGPIMTPEKVTEPGIVSLRPFAKLFWTPVKNEEEIIEISLVFQKKVHAATWRMFATAPTLQKLAFHAKK